jgi:hypothetical protein
MYKLQGYPVDLGEQRRLARQRAEWRRRQAETARRIAQRAVPQPLRKAA